MKVPFLFRWVVFVCLVVCSGCATSGRKAWTDVLAKCADSEDVPRKNLLYFGPSNKVGPGSAWRKRDGGGYGLRFTLADAIPDSTKRNSLIKEGAPADCKGTSKTSWKLKPDVVLEPTASPWSAELKADLGHARTVEVTVDSWKLDRLKELPFEEWVTSGESGKFGLDLLEGKNGVRRVMTEAVVIRGFSAELHFDNTIAGTLHGKYPNGVTIGGGLTGEWVNQTVLKITSPGDFVIAGVLRPMKEGTLNVFSSNQRLLSDKKDKPPAKPLITVEGLGKPN